jgi:hypothetical protein
LITQCAFLSPPTPKYLSKKIKKEQIDGNGSSLQYIRVGHHTLSPLRRRELKKSVRQRQDDDHKHTPFPTAFQPAKSPNLALLFPTLSSEGVAGNAAEKKTRKQKKKEEKKKKKTKKKSKETEKTPRTDDQLDELLREPRDIDILLSPT